MTCQLGAPVFFFLLFPRRRQRKSWSRWFSRRLITLIFAGRNRIIVIRRELPRTSDAGSARRPSAIVLSRILLSVYLSTTTHAASFESLTSEQIHFMLLAAAILSVRLLLLSQWPR